MEAIRSRELYPFRCNRDLVVLVLTLTTRRTHSVYSFALRLTDDVSFDDVMKCTIRFMDTEEQNMLPKRLFKMPSTDEPVIGDFSLMKATMEEWPKPVDNLSRIGSAFIYSDLTNRSRVRFCVTIRSQS